MSRISASLTHASASPHNTPGSSVYTSEQLKGTVNSVNIIDSLSDTIIINLRHAKPTVTSSSLSYIVGGG
jgi:hypothetical protein